MLHGLIRLLLRVSRETALVPIHLYRRLISPALPPRCRYYPSCSEYAVIAVRRRGIVVGMILACWRLVRCNPWSQGGIDHVPVRGAITSPGDTAAPANSPTMKPHSC